jgi:serine/threonine-protein kinase RsbW
VSDPTAAHAEVTGVMTPINSRSEIDRVEAAVLAALDRFAYPEASRFAIRLALEEGLVNAFLHGHRGLPPEEPVEVSFRVGPSSATISISDQGPGYNPGSVPDPTAEENIELPSGRGLMLIRSFMSEVRHEKNGACLIMRYDRPPPDAA